jgi:uncharacterized damage-inducible protein DinB
MAIKEAFLSEFEQEMATTRKVLDRIPADKLSWKPHEKSMTMGALGSHQNSLLEWMQVTLKQDSFDVAPQEGEPYRFIPAETKEVLLAQFDQGVNAARDALVAVTDEELMQPWSLLQGGQPIFTMPKAVVLRSFVFNHSVHHRGQLSVYLRMNEVPVPSIYGPSADEGMF